MELYIHIYMYIFIIGYIRSKYTITKIHFTNFNKFLISFSLFKIDPI